MKLAVLRLRKEVSQLHQENQSLSGENEAIKIDLEEYVGWIYDFYFSEEQVPGDHKQIRTKPHSANENKTAAIRNLS